jgi:hypothetical protein
MFCEEAGLTAAWADKGVAGFITACKVSRAAADEKEGVGDGDKGLSGEGGVSAAWAVDVGWGICID